MRKNKRSVKVYGRNGYNYQLTPTIMLKGKWLQELGFEIGDYISITCEEGKLIITPDTEREELEKAEAEFLRREEEKFKKKFKEDKKLFRAQFVAEQKIKYAEASEQ